MNVGLLPREHLHGYLDAIVPSMRYDGKKDVAAWQSEAREKLASLLGHNEIAKYAVKPTIEIEYDKYAEDLDCRDIRFRVTTEENVTVPCHLCIPKDAKGKLPVAITMQGHSRGMHISLARLKYSDDAETCNGGDRDFVRRALKEGICAIALEQRCFGENGSRVGTEGVPDCTEVAMRAILLGRTLLGERVWDILRLIDALSEDERFADILDMDKLICLGNSGGGTATIYASALDERIKISVPSCAVCRYADSIGAVRHCECNYVPYIANYFDMGDLCAMVAPRSLVVVNGMLDTDFPISGAKACVEVGREAYKKVGRDAALVHVIGESGHRFYADAAWPHINAAIAEL
jgi:hypothetical protein